MSAGRVWQQQGQGNTRAVSFNRGGRGYSRLPTVVDSIVDVPFDGGTSIVSLANESLIAEAVVTVCLVWGTPSRPSFGFLSAWSEFCDEC